MRLTVTDHSVSMFTLSYLNNKKLGAKDNNSRNQHLISKFLARTPYKRLVIYTFVTTAIALAIIVSVAIILNGISDSDLPSRILKIYSRREWGARPPFGSKPMCNPVEYVLISHTAGTHCQNVDDCAFVLQLIQASHISKGHADIGYNFMIGGDADVYVGRGWDVQNFHNVNNIGISFVGNFVYDFVTPGMVSALEVLLALGVELKKLPSNYKLVCHNQTVPTLSPGYQVYKEVVKFPNYYKGPIEFVENRDCFKIH